MGSSTFPYPAGFLRRISLLIPFKHKVHPLQGKKVMALKLKSPKRKGSCEGDLVSTCMSLKSFYRERKQACPGSLDPCGDRAEMRSRDGMTRRKFLLNARENFPTVKAVWQRNRCHALTQVKMFRVEKGKLCFIEGIHTVEVKEARLVTLQHSCKVWDSPVNSINIFKNRSLFSKYSWFPCHN